jgi:hypothetical protein
MNNEILEMMQDFIMEVKHEHSDNIDIQRISEALDDAIDKELNTWRENKNA